MSFLLIAVTAYAVMYSQGAECPSNQHCSECDVQTGQCTKCNRGYFGRTCLDVCSRRCRYQACELVPDKGIEKCTDGCIPGFQGLTCQRPCDTHQVGCTRCPGGCDGEYCQVSGACFSGCRDSYYGAGCRTCSSRCKSCNRITGTCEECHPPYSGVNCGHSCENCVGGCESGCTQGCRRGFYGYDCTEPCSDTCRPDPSLSPDRQCPDGDSCPPECHSQTGECVHGCVDGWYGPRCSRRCNSNCERCNQTGSCTEGCEPGHSGSACDVCLEQCLNITCATNNAPCCSSCINGSSDCPPPCDACKACLDGVANSSEHNITGTTCRYNCTHNVSSPDCPPGGCSTDVPVVDTQTVKYLVVAVFCILATALCCYCCYRRGLSTNRKRHAADEAVNAAMEQTGDSNSGYMALHHYEDITEGDVTSQLSNQSQVDTGTEECRQNSLSQVSLD